MPEMPTPRSTTACKCYQETFQNTDISITTRGRPYLGSPIGTKDYVESFVEEKVSKWSRELSLLATVAKSQPHAAYAALTHGMSSKS